VLAEDEEDFDLAERGAASRPLADEEAAAYLREPTVLHWAAEEGGVVVGHLVSYVELRRSGEPRQLLLYEIGVREASRRRGVGTALVQAMRGWMSYEGVAEAWVLADNPEAVAFYAACGFVRDEKQPIQMTLTL
jgi:ribosomal protein S18 acetylase RimI-like enzyme